MQSESNIKLNYKGQSLIEVIIALTLSMLILTAISSTVLYSVLNARVSKTRNEATQYAQEALEIARANKSKPDGTYCLDKGEFSVADPDKTNSQDCTNSDFSNFNGEYRRQFRILGDVPENNCVAGGVKSNKLLVKVEYSDGKCASGTLCRSVTLESCANTIAIAGTVTPTFTPTPTPIPQTIAITPAHDAEVRAGSADSNYATGNPISIDNSIVREGFMKFNLSGTSAENQKLVAAKLRFYGSINTTYVLIREASNLLSDGSTIWTQSNLTYNNRPSFYSILANTNKTEGAGSSGYVSLDVTKGLPETLSGEVSFKFERSGGIQSGSFHSKEGTYPPVLNVYYTSQLGPTGASIPQIINSQSGTTTSSSITIPVQSSGVDRMLLVSYTSQSSSVNATYNGVSMTSLGYDGYTGANTGLFYMVNPPVGTYNVVISVGSLPASAYAVLLNGIRTESPFGIISGESQTSSTSITSPTLFPRQSDLVLSASGLNCAQQMSAGAGETVIGTPISTNRAHILSYKLSDGTSTTTSSSWSTSCGAGIFAVAIRPRAIL